MKKIILVNAEKLFLNADSRESLACLSELEPGQANANSRRFNRRTNLSLDFARDGSRDGEFAEPRPSALDSRKLAFPDFIGIPLKNLIRWREKDVFLVRTILLFSLFFVFIICVDAFADTLYLKNGTQFIGKTIKLDAEKVVFKIGGEEDGVEITFFSDEILRIDKAEVSSFITVPFGEGKQIDIPRPTFKTEPVLTEQARTQLERRTKVQKDKQLGSPQEGQSLKKIGPQEGIEVKDLSKIPQSDLFLKQKEIAQELTSLLDKQEQDYFLRMNSILQNVTEKTKDIIDNPAALTLDSDRLLELIKDMPSQLESIIKEIKNLKPPATFVNFHKIYLNNLTLMKDMFLDMDKGDILGSQSKNQELQNMSIELQNELSKILEKKKTSGVKETTTEKEI